LISQSRAPIHNSLIFQLSNSLCIWFQTLEENAQATTQSSLNTASRAECVDPDCNFVHQWVHHAGPRLEIYFNPNEVKEAIVTCGGLFPGLNDVIRHIYTL
jgi:hypothetical protein